MATFLLMFGPATRRLLLQLHAEHAVAGNAITKLPSLAARPSFIIEGWGGTL